MASSVHSALFNFFHFSHSEQGIISWNKTFGQNNVAQEGEVRFDQIVSPAQFGIFTGFVITLYVNYKFEEKV